MIVSFKHRGLKLFYETGKFSKIQPKHKERLRIMLAALDAAIDIRDIDVPGFDLHKLRGNLKDHWAITVNGNWRLTFKFENSDVHILDYIDYH